MQKTNVAIIIFEIPVSESSELMSPANTTHSKENKIQITVQNLDIRKIVLKKISHTKIRRLFSTTTQFHVLIIISLEEAE